MLGCLRSLAIEVFVKRYVVILIDFLVCETNNIEGLILSAAFTTPCNKAHPARCSSSIYRRVRIVINTQQSLRHRVALCMLLEHQISALILATLAARDPICSLKFQALSGYFVDLSEKAQHNSSFRAVTLPELGLIDRQYDDDENTTAIFGGKNGSSSGPWQRFRDHVDYLNEQSEESTSYKVLYITRHGLGFHNTYEADVGQDAWNVSNLCFLSV